MESVLRYGLPVDFLTVLLVLRKYKEQKLLEALDQMLAHRHAVGLVDDEEDDDYRPYVVAEVPRAVGGGVGFLQPTNHKPSPTNAGSAAARPTQPSKWPQDKAPLKRARSCKEMTATQTQQTRYSFLGLRPRGSGRTRPSSTTASTAPAVPRHAISTVKINEDGRWRLTRDRAPRPGTARATAAAARGVLERVARGADA